MNCVKLFSRLTSNKITHKYIINRKILNNINIQICCSSSLKRQLIELEKDDFIDKIIYNEVLSTRLKNENASKTAEPIFVKYLLEKENKKVEENVVDKSEILHFPFEAKTKYLTDENIQPPEIRPTSDSDTTLPDDELETLGFEWQTKRPKIKFSDLETPDRWEINDDKENNTGSKFYYGSCDPNKPVSNVPCGGCGALFHCNDPSIPGFIPVEAFSVKKEQLYGELCQRCLFLRELNFALSVNVKTSEYSQVISAIKEKEALVILLVDMLDLPCSIYPGILDIIGPKPVVIVGNKVDLLIQEGPWFLRSFRETLISSLKKQRVNLQNIKNISLISAKTGYGIEAFIDMIYENWEGKGDIYLIGCTNSGKSTFFNTLIQSDFCKAKAENLLQRATVSEWPGTTLSLIKFPINRISKWKVVARSVRLRNQMKEFAAAEEIQSATQNLQLEQIPLKGFIDRTRKEPEPDSNDDGLNIEYRKGINPESSDFVFGKWFYDTPGVVHDDQILNILTTEELLLTVPKKMLLPRNFLMKPGHSLFIAGLARLDYIKGPQAVWFTVFASMELPLTVTKLEDADYVYEKLLGTQLFCVPTEGKQRLAKWPKLASKKFEVVGSAPRGCLRHSFRENKLEKQANADIVLSSAGWVSLTVNHGYRHMIEAWTPEGRGIHLREIPLIKTGYAFRGKKIPGTPAFEIKMKEVEGISVTEEPPV